MLQSVMLKTLEVAFEQVMLIVAVALPKRLLFELRKVVV